MSGHRIEDYAMIGDCRTAAIVSRDGSIDWFCVPRFDSASCFTKLLGDTNNGRWRIAPREVKHIERRYRGDTMILETTFHTDRGVARLTDFMPIGTEHIALVRIAEGIEGEVDFNFELVIRFDYGVTIPWVSRVDSTTRTAVAGPHLLVLRTPAKLRGRDMRTLGRISVKAGDKVPFLMSYGESHLPLPPAIDPIDALSQTEKFWTGWSSRHKGDGPWRDSMMRSLLTLKALTYAPTGGIVAAATTSLPEQIGGSRNWDYRYCWLRDATFTLLAFMNAGYMEEANVWQQWLMRVIAGAPSQMQSLYGVAGERRLDESTIPWLAGYEESKPVRIGNAATQQLQLDVYGELADVMTQARRGGLPEAPRRTAIRQAVLEHLEKIWREPDEGIWEIRASRKHFTHSKVMTWVAFDRAAQTIRTEEKDRIRWRAIADEIHAEICAKAIDPKRGCFVQSYESMRLDANLLLLPVVGFLPVDDLRIKRTIEEIERHLIHDGLVIRYETESGVDGLPPGEGAFLACSFWLADNYILLGRLDDARRMFARLASLANDVGLFAEEYDPRAKRMLGNFPQAFSHVALVNTALNLMHAERSSQRPGEAEPVLRHQ